VHTFVRAWCAILACTRCVLSTSRVAIVLNARPPPACPVEATHGLTACSLSDACACPCAPVRLHRQHVRPEVLDAVEVRQVHAVAVGLRALVPVLLHVPARGKG